MYCKRGVFVLREYESVVSLLRSAHDYTASCKFQRRTIAKIAFGNKMADEEYFRPTASRPEVEVIQPGLALFLGTWVSSRRKRRIGKGSRVRGRDSPVNREESRRRWIDCSSSSQMESARQWENRIP
jgi:hypothetical protein